MSEYALILVTTDFSDAALAGVAEAARLARLLGSRITLLYAVEDRLPPMVLAATGMTRDELLAGHRQTAEENLERYAAEHLAGLPAEVLVRVGRPSEVIVATAREIEADLVVMATHGYGIMGQVIFGSTAERVVQHAPCPVLVVRSRDG